MGLMDLGLGWDEFGWLLVDFDIMKQVLY